MSDREHIIAKVLRAARADLEQLVMPNLTEANAASAAVMINDLLAYLAIWHDDLPRVMEDHLSRRRSIAARADAPKTEADGALTSDLPAAPSDYDELSQRLDRLVVGRASRSDVHDMVAADAALYGAEMALIKAEQAAARTRIPEVELEVTADRLTDLLAPMYGAGSGFAVESFRRAPGGYAKDTFLVEARRPDGRSETLAIRRDLPFPSTGNKIGEEYAALTRLAPLGLSIAEPLHYDGEAILGQPSMVSRGVTGKAGEAAWSHDASIARSVCHQLAEFLARLHSLSPAAAGLAFDPDAAQQLRNHVQGWRARWLDLRNHPSPTIAAGFQWLLENIPQRIERLAIIHGDVGFHNLMVDAGQVTAILDWEFVHIGDPVEDLGYVRHSVEAHIPWGEFLEVYRGHGGSEYVEDSARFFEIWRSVRNAVCCAGAWRGFLNGAYPALKMAYQGVPLYRLFTHELAQSLEKELR